MLMLNNKIVYYRIIHSRYSIEKTWLRWIDTYLNKNLLYA